MKLILLNLVLAFSVVAGAQQYPPYIFLDGNGNPYPYGSGSALGSTPPYAMCYTMVSGQAIPCVFSGGGGPGTIVASPQYELPFFSAAGTANTLTGSSTITTPNGGLLLNSATGGDLGAGNVNISGAYYINGVAIGAGSVTSVSGTANQIDSSGGTTPALSLDSAIQLPGTLVGTSLNNWAYVDGFTSALYPGIGQAQVAFASTNEPLCQAVSYSAANYIAVATGNGATTPGTNSAVWYPVQNANTPTQLDCAFYYTAAANQTAGRASALMFGNTISFSTDYATSIGLLEPILYRVSLIGVARGFNGGPTQIKSNYGGIMLDGQEVVSPTSLPYDFDIENIDFNANNIATACIRAYGFKVSHWEHLSCHNWIATSTQAPITIGDGTAPYYNGGYQNYFDDLFVSGSGNNSSQWATVTVSTAGGVPSFTVTGGGTYTYSTSHVLFWGFSQGANPCTVMGTLTPTWSGSAGNYTLSSISASGFSGCAGPYYIQVPDISPAGYGIEVSLMTDSTFKDMVVKSAGWQRGIFYNSNSSSVMIHDHVYGGSEWLISENSGNSHYGEEPDTPTYVAIETESAGATWTDTQLTQGGGGPPGTGTIGFFAYNNNGNIIQSTCPNTSTSANVFSLVLLESTGPVAHGGNYGNVNVVNGQQCDTLTSDNSFAGKLNLPASTTTYAPLNVGAGSAPSSPVNGDFWSTSSGFYGRVAGSTVGPFGSTSIYSGYFQGYCTDAGSANVYTLTCPNAGYTGAVVGNTFFVKLATSNTAGSTVTINGGSSHTLGTDSGAAVPSGFVQGGNYYSCFDSGGSIFCKPYSARTILTDNTFFYNNGTNSKTMQFSLANLSASVLATINLPPCTANCSGTMVVGNSESIASSATPTFTTATLQSYNVLTANVTSFTLPAGYDGQPKNLIFCQNGTGGFTVAAPSNVHGFFTVGTTALKCNAQSFTYSFSQTAWEATGTGVINE